MSNRTIIEINHDMWHKIESNAALFGDMIAEYMRACDPKVRDNLEQRFGANVLATVHHSDDVRISFGKNT